VRTKSSAASSIVSFLPRDQDDLGQIWLTPFHVEGRGFEKTFGFDPAILTTNPDFLRPIRPDHAEDDRIAEEMAKVESVVMFVATAPAMVNLHNRPCFAARLELPT
jgi:hypothetical protein